MKERFRVSAPLAWLPATIQGLSIYIYLFFFGIVNGDEQEPTPSSCNWFILFILFRIIFHQKTVIIREPSIPMVNTCHHWSVLQWRTSLNDLTFHRKCYLIVVGRVSVIRLFGRHWPSPSGFTEDPQLTFKFLDYRLRFNYTLQL